MIRNDLERSVVEKQIAIMQRAVMETRALGIIKDSNDLLEYHVVLKLISALRQLVIDYDQIPDQFASLVPAIAEALPASEVSIGMDYRKVSFIRVLVPDKQVLVEIGTGWTTTGMPRKRSYRAKCYGTDARGVKRKITAESVVETELAAAIATFAGSL